MADLVVRDDLLLVIGQNGGLALLAGDDNLDALLEVLLGRTFATEADGAKGALVNDIGQIGTGSTGSVSYTHLLTRMHGPATANQTGYGNRVVRAPKRSLTPEQGIYRLSQYRVDT